MYGNYQGVIEMIIWQILTIVFGVALIWFCRVAWLNYDEYENNVKALLGDDCDYYWDAEILHQFYKARCTPDACAAEMIAATINQ